MNTILSPRQIIKLIVIGDHNTGKSTIINKFSGQESSNNTNIEFYTKISNASKYDDTEGIVNHCTNYLNTINPDKWSWIMDFDGFGLRHTLGINTGLRLSQLINKFGRLNYLIIINTNTFVEQMLSLIKFTLNKEYHGCIKIVHPNDAFIKKIREEWHCTDTSKTLLNALIE